MTSEWQFTDQNDILNLGSISLSCIRIIFSFCIVVEIPKIHYISIKVIIQSHYVIKHYKSWSSLISFYHLTYDLHYWNNHSRKLFVCEFWKYFFKLCVTYIMYQGLEHLMQCNVLSSKNLHENIEIMVSSYITSDVEIFVMIHSHGMYHLPWKGW